MSFRAKRGIYAAGHDHPVIADLTRNPEVKGGAYNKTTQLTPARHTGFKAVSTGMEGDATASQTNLQNPPLP